MTQNARTDYLTGTLGMMMQSLTENSIFKVLPAAHRTAFQMLPSIRYVSLVGKPSVGPSTVFVGGASPCKSPLFFAMLGKPGQATSASNCAMLGVSHFQERAPHRATAKGVLCRRQRRP